MVVEELPSQHQMKLESLKVAAQVHHQISLCPQVETLLVYMSKEAVHNHQVLVLYFISMNRC